MAFMGRRATEGAGIVIVLCMMIWAASSVAEAARGSVGSIKLSRKKVSIYFHDTLNVSDYIVVKGINFKPVTPLDASFGTIFVYNDIVTETADPHSPQLGNLTGTYIASTLPYGHSYLMPFVVTLVNTSSASNPDLHGLDGTVSTTGIVTGPDSIQPQPITGGTGFFAFALGTYTLVPIDISTFVQVFRLDFDLYWPPYSF